MYHSFLNQVSADGHLGCLLPCPGYCKQCCDEHWGTCVSFNSGFLSVYAQQWDCCIVWQFYFWFFSTLFSIVAVLVCITTNSVRGFPFIHTLSSIHCLLTLDSSHPDQCEMVPHFGFDLHFSDNVTPVFLTGEFHGQRNLAAQSPWVHK